MNVGTGGKHCNLQVFWRNCFNRLRSDRNGTPVPNSVSANILVQCPMALLCDCAAVNDEAGAGMNPARGDRRRDTQAEARKPVAGNVTSNR